jgi:glycosyltransferase involved in cell wall biosynthesis
MAGYWLPCFQALAAEEVDLHVVYRSAQADAPYKQGSLDGGFPGHRWDGEPDEARLMREIESFAPDVLLVGSWDVGAYRRLARRMRGRALRILGMDNQWLGTAKQWGGTIVSPLAIRPCFDAAFVPGERQAEFARRLGFGDERLLWGFYTCDYDSYSAVNDRCGGTRPQAFLYAGRLSPVKGIAVLAEAYSCYRASSSDAWPLVVCGTGSMSDRLAHLPGVEMQGFVQPADFPRVLERVTCLVLPSTFEPWGVVVHEAAAAGLAIICSTAVGASSRFVVDGYNGLLVPPADTLALASAMTEIAQADAASLAEFGQRSAALAAQFTPRRWARYLVDRSQKLRRSLGLIEE